MPKRHRKQIRRLGIVPGVSTACLNRQYFFLFLLAPERLVDACSRWHYLAQARTQRFKSRVAGFKLP